MQSLLIQLELINRDKHGLKERLFEWVADLGQEEFDQLCNEIVSLDKFFKKYEGAMVTDNAALVRPFVSIIPKVEFVVDMNRRFYNKVCFYRWLEAVPVSVLQSVCQELEDCCDYARELANTYVVSSVYSAFRGADACWKVYAAGLTENVSQMATFVQSWGTRIVRKDLVTV